MKYYKSIFLTCFFCYAAAISAQDSTLQMENVIITASLAAQQQKESGRNIIVLNGESFSKLPVHSVDELFRYLPGIEVQQRGPQGSQSDIVIRGGTFQQVLVIIDGVKLNDPLTGHFNLYIPIHPAEIERVEILKGAASAIWGSEAVGGVINIITKTFSADKSKNELKAGIVAGEYGHLNGNAYFSRKKNRTTVAGGVLSNNAEGQMLRGTKSFFHLTTAIVSFSQQLQRNWKLSLRTAADFRKFNSQNFYTTFASDTSSEKVNSSWMHLNLQKKYTRGSVHFDAAYKLLRDQYWFRPSSVPNANKTKLFMAQVHQTYFFDKNHNCTSGWQVQQKKIESNDRGNHSLWHGAAYAIFRHRLPAHFFLNESLRLDWDENYEWVLVPQINIAWSYSKFTLRASAGKSFRDADFTERYNNYNKELVTSGRIGNPDLKAEQAWNAEAGADYSFSVKFRVSGTVFYRDHDNLIDWANTPYASMPRKDNLVSTGSYALAKNVEQIKTSGAEIDIVFNEKTGQNAALLATAGFTWLKSKNDDPVPSFYISSHAKFLANFSVAYTIKAFSFSVTGIYKKRVEQKSAAINAEITPSYFILNTKAVYTLPKKFGKIFFQADNLFDKNYSDLLGSLMPGRWLSAGFEIALQP